MLSVIILFNLTKSIQVYRRRDMFGQICMQMATLPIRHGFLFGEKLKSGEISIARSKHTVAISWNITSFSRSLWMDIRSRSSPNIPFWECEWQSTQGKLISFGSCLMYVMFYLEHLRRKSAYLWITRRKRIFLFNTVKINPCINFDNSFKIYI